MPLPYLTEQPSLYIEILLPFTRTIDLRMGARTVQHLPQSFVEFAIDLLARLSRNRSGILLGPQNVTW